MVPLRLHNMVLRVLVAHLDDNSEHALVCQRGQLMVLCQSVAILRWSLVAIAKGGVGGTVCPFSRTSLGI